MLFEFLPGGKAKMSTLLSGDSDPDINDFDEHMSQFSRSRVRGKYALKLQDLLYQQSLQNSEFCDVTLQIDTSVVKAHWSVLVICPYFQSLYDSGMKESVSGKLTLNFGAPYAMKDAIKFLYTGEVNVTLERVQDLLEVADYLQIAEMTEVCVRYLKGVTITLDNCVRILLLSSLHGLETYDNAFKFVGGHLPELMNGSDMLDFTPSSLLSLVTDTTLSYVKREDFFNFLVRWTEQDKEHRKKDFEEIFCALDLHSVQTDVIANVIEKHPMVQVSQKCQVYCLESKLKGMVGTAPGTTNMHDVIVLGGGLHRETRFRYLPYPRQSSSHLFAYFVREERWARLPDLPYSISKPLMAITDEGKVLVIDSVVTDNRDKQRQLLCYCPRTNTWTSSKMNYPSAEFDFQVHSLLYACGRLFLVASSKCQAPSPPPRPSRGRTTGAARREPSVHMRYHVQLLELNWETGDLSIKYGLFQRSSYSEIQAVCQQVYNGTTLNGGIIYVIGSKCIGFRAKTTKGKYTKLFFYDINTGRAKEVYGNKIAYEPMAFGFPEGFLTTRLGKVNYKFFQQTDAKVIHHKDYTVKLPPSDAARESYAFTSINDEVYIFGGKMVSSQEPSMSTAKFSFATGKWTELDPLPSPLIGAGIARGRMPVDVLRCHLDCPHCSYLTAKDKPQYNVAYGHDRFEEAAGGRLYDMDDSDGSDDYDMYEYDYEPSYSDDGWGWGVDPDELDLFDLF